MSPELHDFTQYIRWLDSTVGLALSQGNHSELTHAATAFRNAYSLSGYSLERQVEWFARMLADVRFARSQLVHEFGMDIEVDQELLPDASRQALADSYLASLSTLSGDADLVCALSFLASHQSPQKSLEIIEQRLLAMASDSRLNAFIFDALRMYSIRGDISAAQLARAREMARIHFSSQDSGDM
jgi:hypothetical protein